MLGIVTFGFYQINKTDIVKVHPSYAIKYNPRSASRSAQYIVIGKVNKIIDTEVVGFPKTLMQINVEENLKGNIGNKFIFTQDGGKSKDNKIIQFDEYKILTPGQSYVFFLKKHNSKEDIYWSVGGEQTVYGIKGDLAKNTIPGKDIKLKELKNIIKSDKDKLYIEK